MTHAPELLAALNEAVEVTLREFVASAPAPGPEADDQDVATALPVRTATGVGFFALTAPGPVAAALARAVLGAACPDPDPDLVRDALGELLNVVAGQAKTLLSGTAFHFTLGTPGPADASPSDTALHLTFESPFGPFQLAVMIPS